MIKKKGKGFAIPTPLLALLLYSLLVLITLFALKYATLIAVPIFFSFIIAYLFNPLVDYLDKHHILSRGLSAGLLMLSLVVIFIFTIINLFPYFMNQVSSAADRFPLILQRFSAKIEVLSNYITKNFSEYVGNISLMDKIEEMIGSLLNNFSQLLLTAFSSLYSVLITFIYLIFIPLFSFYFIKDYRKIQKTIFNLIPHRFKEAAIHRIEKLDIILSSFIRGQAIVVFILASLYSIGLSIIGLPFAILIGIFSGLGDIIPYFGTVIGLIISLIVGFTSYDSPERMVLVLVVFALVKGSEHWFIYPKIVGSKVGLHFVWVLLSIVFFGKLFGFWGLLISIPSAAGFKMYIMELIGYYKKSPYFNRDQ